MSDYFRITRVQKKKETFKMIENKSLFQEVELLEQVRMEKEGGHYLGTKGCILRKEMIHESDWI